MPLRNSAAEPSNNLINQEEHPSFYRGALAWRGSVTPRILLGVLVMTFYTLALALVDAHVYKLPQLAVTPFEYTGAVLGLVLVFRTNAGHERWWEARKLWGGIVNQSRNLLLMTRYYGPDDLQWRNEMSKWTVVFAFALKAALRQQKSLNDLKSWLSEGEISEVRRAQHMPLLAAGRIAALLEQARGRHWMDVIVFREFEKQRGLLIDHAGGCERIVKTPMPLVYAIKARRFILIYLLLLPFSLIAQAGLMSALIAMLVAYPLLALDRIGWELQNPFSEQNLSHLPLEAICEGIKSNAAMLADRQSRL
ncbi:MAG: bestrophin family protein [Methylomonas sp.]